MKEIQIVRLPFSLFWQRDPSVAKKMHETKKKKKSKLWKTQILIQKEKKM